MQASYGTQEMLTEFFNIILELKKTQRKGWKEKAGIQHPESVADHTYGVSVLAMVFADKYGMNSEKLLKMALLHDLAESVTGDFLPHEISKESKHLVESQSLTEILSHLPPSLSENYRVIWEEYEECKSRESLLIHDLDKLEMALQAAKYAGEGIPQERLQEFIDSSRKEITSKELLAILDTI